MRLSFLFLLWITVVFGVFVEDDGGYIRRGKGRKYYDSSSFSSSSESREGHHHHGNRPRPSRPRPARPPLQRDPSEEDHHGGHGGRPHRPPVVSSKCEDGWTRFDRPQGPWCIKVFYAKQNYQTGVSFCAAMGANVSGYQNAEERMFVANTGRTLQAQQGEELLGEVWVGAIRNPACPAPGSCSPNDQFQWTDGHTTGSDGILWGPGEPNVIHPSDKV
ncbi:hypothetical protein B9Z55_003645 [Caenorhabditis nigoni]|uniref:C-type lectin domain-containing protein n=1 Tax=Caenorhabditis nigoni TaxID=1611254 RepID=A0A2G5VRE7_9PELO|nr:hypothetical protein B9Z55_003645 [Caenorhabditis nigoni]